MRDIPTVCKYSLGELKVCEEEIKNPGQGSSKVLKRLSSEQFYTKAKKAIGDILINKVKVEHSTSSTQPCSSLISLLGSKISMEEDERSSSCSLQPINSVSSIIVTTFVKELTSVIESTVKFRRGH